MSDVKTNFKSLYENNMQCRLCHKQDENEIHLTICEVGVEDIKNEVKELSVTDIWAPFNKQKICIQIFNKIFKIRDLKFEKTKLSNRTQV